MNDIGHRRSCIDCGADISHRHLNTKFCYPCRDADPTRAAVARHLKTPAGYAALLEANARYQKTPKGRAAVRRAVKAWLERPGNHELQRRRVRAYARRKREEKRRAQGGT